MWGRGARQRGQSTSQADRGSNDDASAHLLLAVQRELPVGTWTTGNLNATNPSIAPRLYAAAEARSHAHNTMSDRRDCTVRVPRRFPRKPNGFSGQVEGDWAKNPEHGVRSCLFASIGKRELFTVPIVRNIETGDVHRRIVILEVWPCRSRQPSRLSCQNIR